MVLKRHSAVLQLILDSFERWRQQSMDAKCLTLLKSKRKVLHKRNTNLKFPPKRLHSTRVGGLPIWFRFDNRIQVFSISLTLTQVGRDFWDIGWPGFVPRGAGLITVTRCEWVTRHWAFRLDWNLVGYGGEMFFLNRGFILPILMWHIWPRFSTCPVTLSVKAWF